MPNISQILADLQAERKRVRGELHCLESAIGGLKGLVGRNSAGLKRAGTRRRRTLSVAARNRIAQAQRLRWAKFKQQQKKAA